MALAVVKDTRGGRPARFAKDQLKAVVERIERLEEDKKKSIADDIRDVYAEAKGNGLRREGPPPHHSESASST